MEITVRSLLVGYENLGVEVQLESLTSASIEENRGERRTRRQDRLLDSNSLVQSTKSSVLGLQSRLKGVVTSKVFGGVGISETVVLEYETDNLLEDLSSSLLVLIVIVVAEDIERGGLEEGRDGAQRWSLDDLKRQPIGSSRSVNGEHTDARSSSSSSWWW